MTSRVTLWTEPQVNSPYYLIVRNPSGRRFLLGFSEIEQDKDFKATWALFGMQALEEMRRGAAADHWTLEIHSRHICLYHSVDEREIATLYLPAVHQ